MRWSLLPILLVAGCSAPQVKAPPPPPPAEPPSPAARIRDAALKESRAHEWARDLADRVGPRLAGSRGDARAVAWATAAMESIGLQNVRTEPVKVPRWVRGVESAQVLT